MGRLWLALALVLAFSAPAFAIRPHVPELFPSAPRVTSAYLEIGAQRTSAGLYDVERIRLEAVFDPATRLVEIAVRDASGRESIVSTTPDQLDLVRPKLLAPVGTVELYVRALDAAHIASSWTEVAVVAQRVHATAVRCGEAFGLVIVGGAVLGIVLMLGLLFKMRATEVERERRRREAEATGLVLPAAENHIRTVALRALLALVVVTAIVVGSLGIELWFLPIYGAPALIVIAVTALHRVVNAARAIALLHRPGARASTRYDQLEVAAGSHHVTLRSSPRLVDRARMHALPRAQL